jgi:hemerythrin-like domain-containing protein
MVQRAISDHRYIRQQIEDLANYSGNKVRESLARIADMVYEHVRYEERDLFPHLERKLRKEQLENIGEQIEKHHLSSLQDQYEDQFWNTK